MTYAQAVRLVFGSEQVESSTNACILRMYQDIDDLIFEVGHRSYPRPSSEPSTEPSISERPSIVSSGIPIAHQQHGRRQILKTQC